MSNKNVLYVVAGIFAVGLGVAGYYHKNHSDIVVTENQANTIIESYRVIEICTRVGLIKKAQPYDLENLAYRVRFSNGQGYANLDKTKFEKIVDAGVASVNNSQSQTGGVANAWFATLCEQQATRAKNIKQQYN